MGQVIVASGMPRFGRAPLNRIHDCMHSSVIYQLIVCIITIYYLLTSHVSIISLDNCLLAASSVVVECAYVPYRLLHWAAVRKFP
ncbi:hypothetical protein BDQ94DRAFT_151580 [Aspergillus welwitschiae]|uniref:Uncharacterized protein n=1 Tax=Aspergillus welwitschiae TaxID=1341132 RepID=A0A3F3PPQ2_9EURO|nr:hypothetical protein BDQ94DRAFT_151580 [Aspergillus welwitschiae]RDH28798.1 hypothetical protein BDQ94DRAFT_151580 [Aspergillus welwitschiae]